MALLLAALVASVGGSHPSGSARGCRGRAAPLGAGAPDRDGATPLHHAAARGRAAAVATKPARWQVAFDAQPVVRALGMEEWSLPPECLAPGRRGAVFGSAGRGDGGSGGPEGAGGTGDTVKR